MSTGEVLLLLAVGGIVVYIVSQNQVTVAAAAPGSISPLTPGVGAGTCPGGPGC
jgi:hypothetical protein